MSANVLTWGVAALATSGVIARPWRLPEAVWAVLGALILVLVGVLPWFDALHAVGKGLDVYLFLTGMMLLSEVARREGLFDWLAALAVRQARGSARRLFLLIYAVGVVVTAFLSNDATAVVLTPAVYAATRAAKAEPLPYLFVCAFTANAASFLLPISNPANLVLYASRLPPLPAWLGRFLIPSLLSVVVTFVALWLVERRALRQDVATGVDRPALGAGGRAAAIGIALTAAILLAASSMDVQLGLPTCVAGVLTVAIVLLRKRETPWGVLCGVSWAVLPLVAGLFVLVESLARTGLLIELADLLHRAAQVSVEGTAWAAGMALALACNLMNNLPAGLVAATSVHAARVPQEVTDALLVGVDLGPNLSVTGSLATILWLVALRREGLNVSFWRFLRAGVLVMPPALLAAMAGLLLIR